MKKFFVHKKRSHEAKHSNLFHNNISHLIDEKI